MNKTSFLGKCSKKGQAEIFGLIIIVLLLIFALLFFVKTRQEADSTLTFRINFRANNLLNAIVNLRYEDNGVEVNMKEMLKACSENLNACEGVRGNLTDIFSNSLNNEQYKFTAIGNEKFNFPPDFECDNGISSSPARLPGGYEFRLKICS